MSFLPDEHLIVVVGHYGCGKTNFALNLAFDAAKAGNAVTLVDLDIVNPYFRSSDYAHLIEEHGITLVSPVLANSTLDTPSLSAGIYGAIEQSVCDNHVVILDVGGDDVGAACLRRFRKKINEVPNRVFYVINARRYLTGKPEEAAEVLGEIEAKSELRATDLVCNTHLKTETTLDTVLTASDFNKGCAKLMHLPIFCVCVPADVLNAVSEPVSSQLAGKNLYPVKVIVKTLWE